MNQNLGLRMLLVTAVAVITGCSSQIQITPKEKELVREERSKYGVTCSGPNLSEFQWRGPAGIISRTPQFRVHSVELPMHMNQTGLLLVFERVLEEDVGNYYCSATGKDGRSHTISIKLTVTKVLEFDTPAEQTTDEYSDYFIKCKVKGTWFQNANPTFMWSYNDRNLKERSANGKYSVQDGGLLIRNVTHLDAGKYTCRAFLTTSKSSVSGDTMIDLKVRHKPVFLNYMEGDPVNLYVFQSESINLTCRNSAEPAANMSWSFNDKYFVNPSDHYIVTFNKLDKLGSYTCTATNSLGKITRRFILIEGFKPKTPVGLSIARVGDNYIELKVESAGKEDQLIGYRVEYEARALDSVGKTFESFNMIDFNTTEGPFALVNLVPDTEYTTKILAKNRAGESKYTEPIVVRTLPIIINSGAPPARQFDGLVRVLLIAAVALIAARL